MPALHWNPSLNLFCTIIFFLAATFGFNGCSDVSSTSAPPPPPPPPPPPVPTVLTITTGSPINGTVKVPFNVTLAAVAGTPPLVWSIVGTNQSPGPGLTLNSTTGVISGTPTSASITTQTYIVVDSTKPTAQTAEKTLTISIAAPQASITSVPQAVPTITPFTLPNGTVNVAYPNIQLEATGGIPPYTWSVAPALPNGLFLNLLGPGVISGTPLNASHGPTTHTFTVMDSSMPTGQVSELTRTFTINAALTIDTGPPAGPPLPAGTVGQPYNAILSASGGTGPGTYTWSIVGNQPPAPGLQPLSSDGILSGTPTTPGSLTNTYRVQDNNGVAVTKSLTLTVHSALTIDTNDSTLPLPAGIVGQPYSAALGASGGMGPGTYRWSLAAGSPALPNGLTLNPDGTMLGTPTTAGTSTPTFSVADATSTAVEKRLSITINNPAPPHITTTSLPAGTFDAAYNQTLQVTGGIAPLTWGVIMGALPNGLSLTASTGQISGTATATGTFSFTVQVTDAIPQSDTKALSITINPPPPPSITSPNSSSLPTGTVNQKYPDTQLTATGGAPSYSWSVSPALPNGLSLDLNSGVISGTPLSGSNNDYNPTFTVTDSTSPTHQTATRSYTLRINANVTPMTITTTSLPSGTVCSAYSQPLAASGGTTPYTWSSPVGSVALPAGLSLSASGVISGTPTTAGTTPSGGPTFKVVDNTSPNQQSATKQLSITINPDATLQITTTTLPSGTKTTPYSQPVAATGGCSPLTWTIIPVGSLPPPLTINATTGLIDGGTPTTTGTFPFTVRVTDSLSTVVDQALSITIN